MRRIANGGFLVLAGSFFVLPGTWIFYLSMVTGYAHGFQGMYRGLLGGRFSKWIVLAGLLVMYPMSLLPPAVLTLTTAALVTFHFITDEFHLLETRPTALTKALLPSLFIILLGALCIHFRLADKTFILSSAFFIGLLGIGLLFRRIRRPTHAEAGIGVLFLATLAALLFTGNDKTSALVHLVGLIHFWSWYVQYYARNKSRQTSNRYLKECLLFFAAFALIGVAGWFFEISWAVFLVNPRLYFSWVIIHCLLSFRREDIRAWLGDSPGIRSTESVASQSQPSPKLSREDR